MATKQELGRIGQKRSGGIHGTFFEEFVPELAGKRGVEVYKEMSENDDVLNAILFVFEMLIRQCEFNIEPGGKNDIDREAAEFIEGCLHDMEETWQDTLSEILSFLVYGWSYHEIVYKRRLGGNTSKYDDGLIGWKKLPIRAQETLYEWRYKEGTDDLLGMVQIPPPDYEQVFIPCEKALHFRTKSKKNNPEGRSLLRGVYRAWYIKKRLQEIEGIGAERDLVGYPFIQPPEDVDIWDETDKEMVKMRKTAEQMIRTIRRDESEGMLLPAGWTFSLVNAGSKRQFDVGAIIDRYDRRMATVFLADFLFLGQGSTGSFALSSDKTRLFALAVGTYLDVICDAFNRQAIKRLLDLNGSKFSGMTDYPKMTHGDVEEANLERISKFISDMVNAGVIIPDTELEKYARKTGNIPISEEADDDYNEEEENKKRLEILGVNQNKEGDNPPADPKEPKKQPAADGDPPKIDDEKDLKEAEEAKKSLGR